MDRKTEMPAANHNGEIDTDFEIINLTFHVHRLQELLTALMHKCQAVGVSLTIDEVLIADNAALAYTQTRFPQRKIGMPETKDYPEAKSLDEQ